MYFLKLILYIITIAIITNVNQEQKGSVAILVTGVMCMQHIGTVRVISVHWKAI